MKVSLGWLKEHLDTDASLDAIVEALTRIGLEVEGVHNPGEALAAFRVARVLTAAPHPQADKLQVLSVDAGDGPVQVVCGAPNARAGLVGVFGAPGTYVPGADITLKVAAIRGVESNGMMCSTRELRLGDDHDGIIELPADAPVGASYADYAGLTDPVIDVSVTPNRQDCMGVRGIARDLAAAGLGVLKALDVDPVMGEGAGPDVRTESDACPAFYAQGVAGLRNGEAPAWMQRRLRAIGQKPISALVDITNYVMFDLGRPLHVYDRAKLSGGLVARAARDGESVVALNGKTYTLAEGMTVIADDACVHDIGGIMGGVHSGVSADTTDVVIECAYFDPPAIARTGQALTLTSDARARFERGVDPAFLDDGLAIATRMVLDLCGGTASGVTRAGTPPVDRRIVPYDPHLCRDLGGLHVAPERQARILLSLGFCVGAIDHADAFSDALFATIEGRWPVRVPAWRRDIDGAADLVEEVIRIEGIDKVPAVPLARTPGVARPTATPEQKLERRVRRAAAARGLDEAVTWSFLSEAEAAPFGGSTWTLANPISEELKAMRPSLLPGLLSAAARNLNRGATSVRLFEIGRRYLADAERATLGIVLAGDRRPRGWREGKAAGFDAYDAKAEAIALLAAAGAPVDNLQVMGEAGDAWHPGQSGTLRLGPKTVLATFGNIHPSVLKAFALDGPAATTVAGVELYLDAIPARRQTGFARAPYAPPALQPVRRDFAFVVPTGLAADALVRAVRGADKAAIVGARAFDVFAKEGETSIAVEIVLQPTTASFTDAQLKATADKVVAAAAKLGRRCVGEWITIVSDRLAAAIDPLGAELSSLRDAGGRELMTDADPAFWSGRAPILFPVVGRPAGDTIRIDGRSYPMKQHGFARRMAFAVVEHAADRVTFRLVDGAETRAHYPFAFRLDVAFRVERATLAIEVTITNPGEQPLPASFGFHPAFAWPLPYGRDRADHRIVFAADEPDALRAIAADGTIAPGTRASPLAGRTLALDDALFADDALVWDAVRSDRVTYGADDGPRLEIGFPDTPMLGIWTKPGAHYVCVEPWHGIADPQGYQGEFRDKPGVFEVAPGGEKRIAMSVVLTG